jgi:hypothetical protein
MSEDQQDAVLGRTLKEYQAARRHLAALHAEAGSVGHYLSAAGHALKTNHSLYPGEHFGPSSETVDIRKWPTANQITQLVEDIIAAQREKNRLGSLLEDAGFTQSE